MDILGKYLLEGSLGCGYSRGTFLIFSPELFLFIQKIFQKGKEDEFLGNCCMALLPCNITRRILEGMPDFAEDEAVS